MKLYRLSIQFEAVIAADMAAVAKNFAQSKPEKIAELLPPEFISAIVLGEITDDESLNHMKARGWDAGSIPMRDDRSIGEILAARQEPD
jgi:hypothetical protein